MASPVKQPHSRRVGVRKQSSSASAVFKSPRLEALLTPKNLSATGVTKWPSAPTSARRPRQRRIPTSARAFSLRRLLPAWLLRALFMTAAISASWLTLIWVMVTQDPAQSGSRVVFVVSMFITIFVTSLPIMHRIFSRFAPSRLQQGNPVLVAGHSFLLASIIVANLSLLLVGSWNVAMFVLIAAITVVVEFLFLARK